MSTLPVTANFVLPHAVGEGPWECRNPLAEHFGQLVVKQMELTTTSLHESARFTCACGYVYTRSISSSGRIGNPKFRDFGPLLAYSADSDQPFRPIVITDSGDPDHGVHAA
jgi:hypothetical protein